MTSPSFAGLRTYDLMYQAAAAGYEGLLGQVTRAGCGNTWSSKPGRENLDFFSGNVNLLGRARAKGDSVSNLISRRILRYLFSNSVGPVSIQQFPLAPMGVLAPVSAHAGHSAQPPIDASGNFQIGRASCRERV